jgi:hypothetical protein
VTVGSVTVGSVTVGRSDPQAAPPMVIADANPARAQRISRQKKRGRRRRRGMPHLLHE